MKTTVLENRDIQLEEVFLPLVLKTRDGEKMSICMRDSGFEFIYEGKKYSAKEGVLEEVTPTEIKLNLEEIPTSNG